MALVLLPDGVSRERAITVLKWLAKGKDTRLTAELSGEKRELVVELLDLCPDPSPRGIRMLVDQLERPAAARPEPVRGPIPELTPPTPRPSVEITVTAPAYTGTGEDLRTTLVGIAHERAGVAPAEPGPPQVGDPVTLAMAPLVDVAAALPTPDVDRLVERVQAYRPAIIEEAFTLQPEQLEVLALACAVCHDQVTYRRGQVSQALTDHYTARQHTDGTGGRG